MSKKTKSISIETELIQKIELAEIYCGYTDFSEAVNDALREKFGDIPAEEIEEIIEQEEGTKRYKL